MLKKRLKAIIGTMPTDGASMAEALCRLSSANLREDDAGMSPAIMDEDDELDDVEEDDAGLNLDSAACSQLQAILAGDGSDAEKIAKIKKIVSDHSDYAGDGEVAESRRRPFGKRRRRAV